MSRIFAFATRERAGRYRWTHKEIKSYRNNDDVTGGSQAPPSRERISSASFPHGHAAPLVAGRHHSLRFRNWACLKTCGHQRVTADCGLTINFFTAKFTTLIKRLLSRKISLWYIQSRDVKTYYVSYCKLTRW